MLVNETSVAFALVNVNVKSVKKVGTAQYSACCEGLIVAVGAFCEYVLQYV